MVSACMREHNPKTQTRRVVRNPDHFSCLTGDCPHWDKKLCAEELARHSPYGGAGDRLWVRESFANLDGQILYPADDAAVALELHCTPSIHMPRKLCRLVLEVLGVRVERLNDITNQDAKAEGVYGADWGHGLDYGGDANYVPVYRELWDSLNAKRGHGWEKNLWVWVVEFKRAQ